MMFKIVHIALAAVLVLTGCATGVSFPSTGVEADVKVTGLLFKPKGEGVHPAVVLLHTCGGLKPHVTQAWPDYLTGLGYVVLSVDSYSPRGISNCAQGIGWSEQADDAYGALDYLSGLPFVDGNRVGVLGFSRGAMAINDFIAKTRHKDDPTNTRSGSDPDFKAAIAFYGRCGLSQTRKNLPLMEIVAEKDEYLAPTCIAAGKFLPIEVHVLRGAHHAFDSPGPGGRVDPFGNVMYYSAGATTEAEKHVKLFLGKHLGK